jgi:hypothetical protein
VTAELILFGLLLNRSFTNKKALIIPQRVVLLAVQQGNNSDLAIKEEKCMMRFALNVANQLRFLFSQKREGQFIALIAFGK